MKRILIISLLLVNQIIIFTDELKLPNLIGSWFLHPDKIACINKSIDECDAIWFNSNNGIIIRFLDKEIAEIAFSPKSQIKCFYNFIFIKEDEFKQHSYKIEFIQKNGNKTLLFIKKFGDKFQYVYINNNLLEGFPYCDYLIEQGEMVKDSR